MGIASAGEVTTAFVARVDASDLLKKKKKKKNILVTNVPSRKHFVILPSACALRPPTGRVAALERAATTLSAGQQP